MCGIAQNVNMMDACIPEESTSVMGIMSIDKEESILSVGLFLCVLVKLFDPFYANLSVRPSLL